MSVKWHIACWLCVLLSLPIGLMRAQRPGSPVSTPADGAQRPPAAAWEQVPPEAPPAARDALIGDILTLAEKLCEEAGGALQRAHYKGDRYVCKNFVSYLLYQAGKPYRMAAYPNVRLRLPENLPAEACKPYRYGIAWRDVAAGAGNPFIVAASFRYDEALSEAENRDMARAMLEQVARGDFFQMIADYEYGHTPHSLLFIAPYNAEHDTLHWADANMEGKTIGGERYGYVQYDAEASVDWFIDAICYPKHGATLYRLREDIVRVEE